jgi:uncharacterized protein YqhQ
MLAAKLKQEVIMKKTTIGGMALIEGLMMIGPENAAIAVRKPDGEIIIDKRPLPKKNKFYKLPMIRGVVGFFRQMVIGVKALLYSAEFVEIEDGNQEEQKEPSRLDKIFNKIFGDKLYDVMIYITVIVSIAFSIGLFMLLPNVLAGLLHFDKDTRTGLISYNLFEGLIKIIIFFGYLALTSRLKEMKRLWQYHGAEHKTIHCYEHGDEMTIENVKKYSTKHPRCGTSFLIIVLIVSILVFSLLPWGSIIMNVLLRLSLIPLVAALSYELLRFAGRSEWKGMIVINAPGFLFQRFTTREPDESQIEVAIAAFNGVSITEKDADKW